MRKMKWNSPKKVGNSLETEFKSMLDEVGIPYSQEHTVNIKGTRTSGSVDFKLLNPEGYIECKAFTRRLAIGLSDGVRGIKWNQVCYLNKKFIEGHLSGFLIMENSDKTLIFIRTYDLLLWWANTAEKSLSLEQAYKIGQRLTKETLERWKRNEILSSDK